jgi:Beta-1,3-glucanase/Ricin-type beta-trefoil lectin domain-like
VIVSAACGISKFNLPFKKGEGFIMRNIKRWFLVLVMICAGFAATANAVDFTQGFESTGSTTGKLWFKSNVNTTWVDAHYQVNNGGQQNVRMTFSAANARYEQPVTASTGNTLSYFFTYDNAGLAYDSARFNITVGSTSNPPTGITSGAVYKLVNASSNLALDVAGCGTANGTNVQVWADGVGVCNSGAGQAFRPTLNADGTYTLTNPTSGLALDVAGCGTNNNTNIQMWANGIGVCNGGAGQRWRINANSDGTYTLVNPNSNKALDVAGGGASNGTNVQLYDQNNSGAQKWRVSTWTATGNPQTCTGAGCVWNGNTTFNMVNNTRGAYADNQVYWAIIGRDWTTGKFIHVGTNGSFTPMSVSDNGALTKNGLKYTNYFHTLAEAKTVTIPPINSARLLLSVGSPMYIQVNSDINGNIGYAGANIDNPADPNIDVIFDFVEMAIVPGANGGFFGNTTRVDQFGFPVTLRLQGLDGYDQTVGETASRASLFAAFRAEVPAQFQDLVKAPYRIVSPALGSLGPTGINSTYLDAYITSVWNFYTNQTLTFTNQQGTFNGRVVNGVFEFTDGQGTYRVKKPTSVMALLGNGVLNDPTGTSPGTPAYDKQLQIQAQLCAAINRHVVQSPANWYNPSAHYPAGQAANSYSAFWHRYAINGLTYGFAYDDVGGFSSSLHTKVPTTATISIGF